MPSIDYQTAFHLAPVGLVLSRARVIEDCNDEVCRIFGTSREALVGESFQVLYPTADEFERTGARIVPVMNTKGLYSDERIMKRASGELFWCHVTGRSLDRKDPLGAGIWTFEDLSQKRPVTAELTARERDIAAQLVEGKTSKQIGKLLSISPRTVDIYRARLMKKYGAHTAVDLVQRLVNH
ncbi:MAG: helix-turn-helix transcriptional regulator [Cupriavidus sp.]|jgi:PAS domain S-box-containing protein|uniref:PAS and helix-turn-helix domain-containing protein n=1 Tax=Cupriavidus pauculus TaxID=82633 RepID=UPI000783AE9C|nr:PAS and helix-turn-helix domain-containing protein [Cupriavidus pauculus]MBU69679.1 helix-turn-helix transcriptional regulator [Cupriavidus sp.]KAB0600934.1 PAS and helix-turn-helix domain-containing protein [Cupriavidus pauculus]MBY4729493.1 PAS and helix-turn-helix domain-containing protein [Cupriavidus pauculus]MCM3608371.1 PAS and helix-turn-helix domain-containing protein [Cupriavidus pauculus]UAK99263.1 PAS and helix-turn-helix domain-containing protein [Cupriavidus pauculus]